jgi:hypothetical protein
MDQMIGWEPEGLICNHLQLFVQLKAKGCKPDELSHLGWLDLFTVQISLVCEKWN